MPPPQGGGRVTPECDQAAFLERVRLNGSPTRVSGTKVIASVKFTGAGSNSLCKVGKSLVCKGFWETIDQVGRICLPRRSGKTSSLELDKLENIPNSVLSGNGGLGAGAASEMDIAALCRKKRHFMKYPVLYISLSECKGASFGTFIRALCDTLANVAQKWIEEVEITEAKISIRARHSLKQSQDGLDFFYKARMVPEIQMAGYTDLAQSLFQALSTFIAKQFGQYLLLIDKYDIPFISISLAKWSGEDKQAALGGLKTLFQAMLKVSTRTLHSHDKMYAIGTNSFILLGTCRIASIFLKGLLFGVFEIPLTEMGSGANNIKDIRMVPAEESDIQGRILAAAHPHLGCGMDALTDSFWFNAHEVEQMLDNSTECYYIGRLRGKYNPWSVSSFIEALCRLLGQTTGDEEADIAAITKSAARAYWVTTGTTGLIEAQIDRHRPQFIHLAKRLLRDYEATKSKADSSTNNARGALLCEMWEDGTDLLCALATSSHGVLTSHNSYHESDYANHVANAIMAVSRFGMLTHPKQRTAEVSHVVPTRESHADIGRCDYVARLYSSANQPNQLGLIIEFKLIEAGRLRDTGYHRERAEAGLQQDGANNHSSCLVGCLERMDAGMAIGDNAVSVVSQLYKRQAVDAPWMPVSACQRGGLLGLDLGIDKRQEKLVA
ncbi:hypothetical protein GGI20_003592 [Coemansia sp. BCRC 34301]|nr:hypothetical protein GGI20_003592 [Coemansia sp. BCRC 34301]